MEDFENRLKAEYHRTLREWLDETMAAKGWTIYRWQKASGLPSSAIYKIRDLPSHNISYYKIARLANAAGVAVPTPTLPADLAKALEKK